MTRENVQDLLIQLRDLIKLEREHAKELDLEAMAKDIEAKEAILQVLNKVKELHPEDREVAAEIQKENRHNAYLFRATLNWIQDTMEFFGKKTVPATYGQYGTAQNNTINGRLLSGRI